MYVTINIFLEKEHLIYLCSYITTISLTERQHNNRTSSPQSISVSPQPLISASFPQTLSSRVTRRGTARHSSVPEVTLPVGCTQLYGGGQSHLYSTEHLLRTNKFMAITPTGIFCVPSSPITHRYTLNTLPLNHVSLTGGGPEVCTSLTTPLTITYPNAFFTRGPIQTVDLKSLTKTVRSSWRPRHYLTYNRSSHPFYNAVSQCLKYVIMQSCQLPSSLVIANSMEKLETILTVYQLRDLISHGSAVNDAVLFLYLEIFCRFFNFTFLAKQFLHFLKHDGWGRCTRFFTQNK
jgi:hypothetical protein